MISPDKVFFFVRLLLAGEGDALRFNFFEGVSGFSGATLTSGMERPSAAK